MNSTALKKTFLFAVIFFAVGSVVNVYTKELAPLPELVTETFEIYTESNQLIRVDTSHHCNKWVHYAVEETVKPEKELWLPAELQIVADTIIEVTNNTEIDGEAGCKINNLEFTLIGVGM